MSRNLKNPNNKYLFPISILVLLYLSLILFFGGNRGGNFQSTITDGISYLTNTILCKNSSTLEYCRQTTYKSFGKPEPVVYMQTPIYTYLQYNSSTSDTTPASNTQDTASSNTHDANAVVDEGNTVTPDTTVADNSVPLDAGEDISNGHDPYDDLFFEDMENEDAHTVFAEGNLSASAKDTLKENRKIINTITSTLDSDYLLKTLYHVNAETGIDKKIFNVKKLLSTDLTIKKNSKEPQILIYHTHAHEWFADSKDGVQSDTIVGVGDELTRILEDDYGYNVIHYVHHYSAKTCYNDALPDIKAILKKYPSIKMVLDVHRDGVSEKNDTHTSVTIGNTTMCKLMFFNGMCCTTDGPIKGYANPNLQTNLALSLQMRLYAMETFPQLTKYNFLKSWRYNMHLMGRYSLVEVGDNNNTVSEAKAAMKPLADIIDHVLTTPNTYLK